MKRIMTIVTAAVCVASLYIVSVLASVRVAAQTQAPPRIYTAVEPVTVPESPLATQLPEKEVAASTAVASSAPSLAATSNGEAGTPLTSTVTAKDDPWYLEEVGLSRELQQFTYELCGELEVPYSLVLGVMEVESGFRTDALRKGSGAEMVGLMQINSRYLPSHYERFQVDNAYEPQDNITIGVNMLAESIRKNGTVYALMEYNMGIVNMRKKRESGVHSTGYTRKVLAAQEKYAALLEQQGLSA